MIHETPQKRRQEDNRDRILAAAAEIIGQDGLEGLSIKKVASLANYTPGALYRYYVSKDALLAALTVQAVDELARKLMEASESSGLKSITAQAHAYLLYSRERPAMYELLAAMNGSPRILVADETSARAVGDAMIRALLPLAASIGRCANEGLLEPGDSKERAVLLWVGVQGALQLRKQERVAPDFFNADRLSGQMVATLLRGWGADDTNIARAMSSFGADNGGSR
jgi:AcrR family transcriptional regulator